MMGTSSLRERSRAARERSHGLRMTSQQLRSCLEHLRAYGVEIMRDGRRDAGPQPHARDTNPALPLRDGADFYHWTIERVRLAREQAKALRSEAEELKQQAAAVRAQSRDLKRRPQPDGGPSAAPAAIHT
jgi:hypothetical protein